MDVGKIPNIDDLVGRGFTASQIRQSKDSWNSLHLACSDEAYQTVTGSHDSQSSVFAALKDFCVQDTCVLETTCMEDVVKV